ncbi:MAG: NPCBM/NEW2 domain-containing protein, partial [Herpetosiphon sp.]|nr:NPCBM/NEW2 domain-containing protein [Herpetosiphon sp.]
MITYLDTLPITESHVGYGSLGAGGNLGYEHKRVTVQHQHYDHALSSHPPARVRFQLNGQFRQFSCSVALNDDVPTGRSSADFFVLGDGRELAKATFVRPHEPPRQLTANIAGIKQLELVVRSQRWEYAHAVWLDPHVSEDELQTPAQPFVDCLARAEICLPATPLKAKRCIATIVSPGFETLLDTLLGSLQTYGGCHGALVVVLIVGESAECERIVAKYHATAIHCRRHAQINATLKSALYSIAHVVDAQQFICLDADMVVLGDLTPIFGALEACPEHTIFACREGNGSGWHTFNTLSHALTTVYGGKEQDIQRILGRVNGEGRYTLVVNDGLFAGSTSALRSLDAAIRAMPEAIRWVDENPSIWWRNQCIFNLALAQLQCGVELDARYNIQLNSHDIDFYEAQGRIQANWNGHLVRVAHFNGLGRHKYLEWRNRFTHVGDVVNYNAGNDHYSEFLCTLRVWLGRHGLKSLTWSFYGLSSGENASVHDSMAFPLFATLHYVVRSNGCVRVLETGTARGVSAACLASAVAHREAGRVVTFDVCDYPERGDLWDTLPEFMRTCIEARHVDSLTGMQQAIAAGETYHAALLDSLHTAEHVWAEFQLATQLVCAGGLILIHDATYR